MTARLEVLNARRRQAHGRQLKRAAKADLARRGLHARPDLRRMAAPAPQSEVSRRRMVLATTAGKARLSSPELCGMRISKLRHSVFSFTDIMRATWVCIWRRSKVEAQANRLPRGSQLAADDLHHRAENRLLDVGQLAQRTSRPSPPSSRSTIGGASASSSCSTDKRSQRLQAHRSHIADLGNAQAEIR